MSLRFTWRSSDSGSVGLGRGLKVWVSDWHLPGEADVADHTASGKILAGSSWVLKLWKHLSDALILVWDLSMKFLGHIFFLDDFADIAALSADVESFLEILKVAWSTPCRWLDLCVLVSFWPGSHEIVALLYLWNSVSLQVMSQCWPDVWELFSGMWCDALLNTWTQSFFCFARVTWIFLSYLHLNHFLKYWDIGLPWWRSG